ncbi:MAG: hypothetical protein HGA80_05045 [Candidatus Omnitrophica bacterium]|nr:hypothetical protein [Candidatus Omnitrophota bacterium]
MTTGFFLKAKILLALILFFAALSAGRLYYQVSGDFNNDRSLLFFEQEDFPAWDYCDRGTEYFLKIDGGMTFRDAKGLPLEGRQDVTVGLLQRQEPGGISQLKDLGAKHAFVTLSGGVLEGQLEVLHDNGWPALQCSYHEGLRNGVCRSYADSGLLLNETEYAAGQATGVFRSYRADSTLLADGQPGSCQEYAIDGKTLAKQVAMDKARTRGCTPNTREVVQEGRYVVHREYRGFGKDGRLAREASIWDYYSGLAGDGPIYREMSLNGRMFRQETFLWDLHVVQEFDRNGVLRRELHERGGMPDGSARWYDGLGRLRLEGTIHNGKRDGLFRWYGSDGYQDWSAFYYRGQLLGEDLFYSCLNWTLLLAMEALAFLLFWPVYIRLRAGIARPWFYLLVLVLMFGIFWAAGYLAFWLQISFFS